MASAGTVVAAAPVRHPVVVVAVAVAVVRAPVRPEDREDSVVVHPSGSSRAASTVSA